MKKKVLSSFNSEQLDYLINHLRLTTDRSQDLKLSIPSIDLLDETKCSAYLDKLEGIFPSSSNILKASMFAKRYSYMTIASSLFAMTMFNKALDYSVENCQLESRYQDQTWLPNVRLTDWQVTKPGESDRCEWRYEVVKNIFAGNIAKVWRTLSKTANIPITILWENTAIYVYWLYEKRIGGEDAEHQKINIHEDFHFLLNKAPAALFGTAINPLTRFNSPKSNVPISEQLVRIRKTCCYYYQISPDQSCCSTCPRNN